MVGGLTISTVMKLFVLSLLLASSAATIAAAQDLVPQGEKPDCKDGFEVVIIPEGNGAPIYKCEKLKDIFKTNQTAVDDDDIITEEPAAKIEGPDYSQLSPRAERDARLDEIFKRLQAETNAEDADLIAEEVWALWLDSGSPSINFVLRRGSAAHKRKDYGLARRMFDHVTTLSPEYAEGWARSSRLAMEQKDLSRALTEAAQALILEPRHFFALWTMGNIFEQLGRQEEALEAYREANKIYPELKAVKDRLEAMQSAIDGDVL